MKPKSIILKSNTDWLMKQLVNELSMYPNIHFLYKKLNGEYTIIIKCFNYYQPNKKENAKNFYENYIYLYTCISLILAELVLNNYENILIKRILHYNYFYYGKMRVDRLYNIIRLTTSSNSPLENSQKLFLYRKQLILASLLENFRHTNYIHLNGYLDFKLTSYYEFLEEIIFNIVQLSISNAISIERLNVIIKNMFDY